LVGPVNPRRSGNWSSKCSWDEFIKMHAKTLWACDFFSKKVWTLGGLVEYFVLFFIQPGTRRVHIAGITANPDGAWMAQQARNMCMFFDDQSDPAKYLVCDRDTKFTEQFRAILESDGMEVVQTAIRAPNQNAYAERWCQSSDSCSQSERLRRTMVSEHSLLQTRSKPLALTGKRKSL